MIKQIRTVTEILRIKESHDNTEKKSININLAEGIYKVEILLSQCVLDTLKWIKR